MSFQFEDWAGVQDMCVPTLHVPDWISSTHSNNTPTTTNKSYKSKGTPSQPP